jgi:hypothetical protein
MNKQIKQLLILGALIAILVAVFAGNTKKKPGKKLTLTSPATNQQASQSTKNTADSASGEGSVDSKKLALQKQRTNAAWGRDPFSTSVSKEYQRADLILKGISFGGDGRGFAFINNEIVKTGDKLGDYEVVSVERDKVLVKKKDSQSFYLTLPKE